MKYYLAKSEPSVYSIDDLERDRKTVWDGVTNPQAVKAIRAMKAGDRVFLYHSGDVRAVVGIAHVVSDARDDAGNSKSAVVDLAYGERLDPPTSLADVRQSGLFDDWALVRQSRLSTMEAPAEFVAWMRARYPTANL
jgi:predicted RNA-binding protein with PUA-like domain